MASDSAKGNRVDTLSETDKQIDILQDQVKKSPDDYSGYDGLGAAFLQKARETGDIDYYNLAEQTLKKALALAPQDFRATDPFTHMALVCMGEHRFAEALAMGSLLLEGSPVRLTGQDTERGTFNQRHAVLVDTATEEEYCSLAHLAPNQPFCEIHNSSLSEAACVGFEYGFSRDYPEALVLWEAQFGDFVNGAQVIIDQFISAGEDKWDLPSGLVLLLPHGYEGQGPEHSSARIERFMQLAGEENMQICQPSTAAQYFHLLRRQVRRSWRKPLIVFTPKSMLRHPDASSGVEDFAQPRFLPVVPDREVQDAKRILIVSGKLGHELRAERRRRNDTSTAIVFLDQLYPLLRPELTAAIDEHPNAREVVWIQEEPKNMGAHFFVVPRIGQLVQSKGLKFRSIKRSPSASPATGSAKAHELEQKTLISLAFTTASE